MMIGYLEFFWALAICVVGVGLALVYSRRAGLIDVPNQRSSHIVPTPRGGGIALVGSVMAVACYDLAQAGSAPPVALPYLGAVLVLLTVVGLLDDHRSMPVKLRLPVHFACGVACAFLVNDIAPFPGATNIVWLGWWVFWSVASINIVNFMDGIDGLVASQGVVYGLFLFALVPSEFFASRFGLILAGACVGFLAWNWAPARMFMGDVGSGPLGLFLVIGGALALESAPGVLVFLPLFPLFFDALATLVLRLRAGERITQAHRSHLYQRVANSGVAHPLVSTSYALAATIGAIVALSIRKGPPIRIGLSIAAYCTAVVTVWALADARFPRSSPRPSLK
jgi:UDP-N-acetylmuramyl pentapeptide phosphotransferase/UDP-N-acetylglucosamine-1-phosphate transferase